MKKHCVICGEKMDETEHGRQYCYGCQERWFGDGGGNEGYVKYEDFSDFRKKNCLKCEEECLGPEFTLYCSKLINAYFKREC